MTSSTAMMMAFSMLNILSEDLQIFCAVFGLIHTSTYNSAHTRIDGSHATITILRRFSKDVTMGQSINSTCILSQYLTHLYLENTVFIFADISFLSCLVVHYPVLISLGRC